MAFCKMSQELKFPLLIPYLFMYFKDLALENICIEL